MAPVSLALPSYVHAYGSVPFDEAYSSGYLNLPYPTGAGSGVSSYISQDDDWAGGIFEIGGRAYYGTNTSNNANVYLDYSGGAVMDGVAYDVRIYYWKTGSRQQWFAGGPGWLAFSFKAGGDGKTHLEMHFYQYGHCGDKNYEVTFRGVLRHDDVDGNSDSKEGYQYYAGHVGSWALSNTFVEFDSAGNFHGTIVNGEGDDPERMVVWCEVEGSPSNPLHFAYTTTSNSYGSGLNYWGARIFYVLQSDGKYSLPSGATMSNTHGSAIYGTYRYASAPSIARWQFDGWYHDSGMTSHTGATEVITGDKTVYGTYHRVVFDVYTSVSNGSITPTNTNINIGANHTVSYSPNSGYLLNSVVVDGSSVDINSYPDSYTFSNVQSDHSVAVTYAAPTAGKNMGFSLILKSTLWCSFSMPKFFSCFFSAIAV